MSSIEKAIERLSKAKAKNGNTAQDNKVIPDDVIQKSDQGFTLETEAEEKIILHTESLDKIDVGDGQDADGSLTAFNDKVEDKKIYFDLDFTEMAKVGYLTPDSKNKILSEEYRAIKRPILMNALGKGAAPVERGNLVSITSSLPGEGKTYTAVNLALSIATELDSTVLIVDGDILRPQLSALLGLENNKGLTDVLHDPHISISDVLVSTQIPKLKIIPAGNSCENSTELLASDAMEALVSELGNRYSDRIVLFDSPPLLATSEASVLNHHMGQILLVVEAGKTPVDAVKDSLSHLDDKKVIGLVLNKTNGQAMRSGYGSYGGYGRYG